MSHLPGRRGGERSRKILGLFYFISSPFCWHTCPCSGTVHLPHLSSQLSRLKLHKSFFPLSPLAFLVRLEQTLQPGREGAWSRGWCWKGHQSLGTKRQDQKTTRSSSDSAGGVTFLFSAFHKKKWILKSVMQTAFGNNTLLPDIWHFQSWKSLNFCQVWDMCPGWVEVEDYSLSQNNFKPNFSFLQAPGGISVGFGQAFFRGQQWVLKLLWAALGTSSAMSPLLLVEFCSWCVCSLWLWTGRCW